MRQLTEEEKEFNRKAIKREQDKLRIHKLSKEIVSKELELIPYKQEVGMYVKGKELDQINTQITLCEDKINVMIKQNEEGVEEKDGSNE